MASSYFLRYDPFLPVLDREKSPNAYFAMSSFLFWAVMGVACRSYPRDRSLQDKLSTKIIGLALSAFTSNTNTIHDIKALLLLTSWNFTPTSLTHEFTHRLSGIMVHMALQMGLNQHTASQELSRVRNQAPHGSGGERDDVWGHCIVAYQRCAQLQAKLSCIPV